MKPTQLFIIATKKNSDVRLELSWHVQNVETNISGINGIKHADETQLKRLQLFIITSESRRSDET